MREREQASQKQGSSYVIKGRRAPQNLKHGSLTCCHLVVLRYEIERTINSGQSYYRESISWEECMFKTRQITYWCHPIHLELRATPKATH